MRAIAFLVAAALLLSGCGYNDIQRKDEAVKASWSQVLNVYKRRADLVPNLVATVKGYAQQEQQVLIGVTEARAKVGQINVNPDDPASLQQYQKAQGELSGALSRLLVVSEQYPALKSDQLFLGLQTQLEGTENRIAVERERYIRTVQDYNTSIRVFPVNLTAKMFGYHEKPNFTVENEREIQAPPTVDFGAGQAMQPTTTGPQPGSATLPGVQASPTTNPGPQPVPANAVGLQPSKLPPNAEKGPQPSATSSGA